MCIINITTLNAGNRNGEGQPRARIIASADPVETGAWAEVLPTAFVDENGSAFASADAFAAAIGRDGASIEIDATADMRFLAAAPGATITGAARGWRITTGQQLSRHIAAGETIWVRTA
jgi:hypothetical protein